MRWKPFELAVLNSLFRIERRQQVIIDGIEELLKDGPNDQTLPEKLRIAKESLDKERAELQAAIEANQPPN